MSTHDPRLQLPGFHLQGGTIELLNHVPRVEPYGYESMSLQGTGGLCKPEVIRLASASDRDNP